MIAGSSLKAVLDLNWDDPDERNQALGMFLGVLRSVIDRAYLSSSLVKERKPELTIYCKAWRVTNGHKFAKTAFVLDWETGTIRCPNQVTLPFIPGGKVQFPASVCAHCPHLIKS